MQEMFLVWMLRGKVSDDVIQKTVFDKYPIWDFKKDIDSYDIKLPERYCLACKQQIKGQMIVPVDEGFYCNQYCFANRIEQLGNEALEALNDLTKEVEKIAGVNDSSSKE